MLKRKREFFVNELGGIFFK